MFTLTQSEASDSKSVVTGQPSSSGTLLSMLFDSGATHSFVATRVMDQLCRPDSELDRPKVVILPRGDQVVSRRGIRALPVTVDGRELHVDVMELEMADFDLILGMDLLEKYKANIDCKRKTVTFSAEGRHHLCSLTLF